MDHWHLGDIGITMSVQEHTRGIRLVDSTNRNRHFITKFFAEINVVIRDNGSFHSYPQWRLVNLAAVFAPGRVIRLS